MTGKNSLGAKAATVYIPARDCGDNFGAENTKTGRAVPVLTLDHEWEITCTAKP